MILIIMAGGNLIFGTVANIQEFGKMDCVRQAIYHHATEDDLINCLNHAGLFDAGGITWISVQFILIVTSVLLAYIIEKK